MKARVAKKIAKNWRKYSFCQYSKACNVFYRKEEKESKRAFRKKWAHVINRGYNGLGDTEWNNMLLDNMYRIFGIGKAYEPSECPELMLCVRTANKA